MAIKYTDPGDKGYFGMLDYQELKDQGLTDFQIRDFAQKNAPKGIGAKVQSLFSNVPGTPKPPSGLSGITPKYGASESYFGPADYQQALSIGYNPSQIFEYLQANKQLLRNENVPFGGGIYDKAATEAALYNLQQKPAYEDELDDQKKKIADLEKQLIADTGKLKTDFQGALAAQQTQFAKDLANQQAAAQTAQKNLLAQLKGPDRAPAEVRMGAGNLQLRRRGTTGYFGREGLRIGSLNVPTTALSISPTKKAKSTTGSFI